MKAVMYHYVRFPDRKYPYFKGLNLDDFKKQLDWFSDNGGFIGRDEFLDIFKNKNHQKHTSKFILTFDDGLSDHYDFVYPELVKRGIFGIFFIPTLYLESKKILDVHRVHLLVGRHGGNKMMQELKKVYTQDMLVKDHDSNSNTKTYVLPTSLDTNEIKFKKILNYLMSYEHRERILDTLFNSLMEDVGYKDVYMSESEIRELHDSGMIIGSHSESHKLMSRLSFQEQNNEIKNSFATLDSIVNGLSVKIFCYPYGGPFSYNKDTVNILNHHDVLFSFDVNSQDISRKNISKGGRHQLPRYDTVEFPYGISGLEC
jgi:peptidoglycan/xylan/chitin deacetylase (PgdA/CDA1 family)